MKFLQDPHVHHRICMLLTLAGMFTPVEYQKYVFGVAAALSVAGFALPKSMQDKVDALTGDVDK